jgi:hypothetical protein
MNRDRYEQGYSPAVKVIFLCIAWGATIILTYPGIRGDPVCFPIGLPWLLAVAVGHHGLGRTVEELSMFLGWLIYVILSAATFMTTRKAAYVTLYTILCVLLALNVAGCRLFISELKTVR